MCSKKLCTQSKLWLKDFYYMLHPILVLVSKCVANSYVRQVYLYVGSLGLYDSSYCPMLDAVFRNFTSCWSACPAERSGGISW